jgi:hypothetical protein
MAIFSLPLNIRKEYFSIFIIIHDERKFLHILERTAKNVLLIYLFMKMIVLQIYKNTKCLLKTPN